MSRGMSYVRQRSCNEIKKKTGRKRGTGDRTFTVLIEQDEDGLFVASVPYLRSYYTQAKTLEDLAPRIREVIELCRKEEELKSIGRGTYVERYRSGTNLVLLEPDVRKAFADAESVNDAREGLRENSDEGY